MSVLSWRSGRTDRVCRSATCLEMKAVVDPEEELFALRCQWSEMLGDTATQNSPMKWHDWYLAHVSRTARAYTTNYNTQWSLPGARSVVDVGCLALKEGFGTSSTKFFWVHIGAPHGNVLTKDTETEPLASF